jgi:adenosylmethionine-8-amino-7-oxononanoate aminotransferase
MYLNREWAVWLANIGYEHQDFANILTRQELTQANPSFRSPEDKAKLAAAVAQTQQALAAPKAALVEAEKTTGVH